MKRSRQGKSRSTFTWISLKTTGSDSTKDHILEVACIITSQNLKYISPAFKAVVHYPEKIVADHHLSKKCIDSPYTLENIETALLQFIKDRTDHGTSILAGNNIEFTVPFLKQMPSITEILNHRVINVCSVRELCWKWNPSLYKKYPKVNSKRALPETKEAIKELQWYRDNFFICEKRMIILTMPKKI